MTYQIGRLLIGNSNGLQDFLHILKSSSIFFSLSWREKMELDLRMCKKVCSPLPIPGYKAEEKYQNV